jgi:hypothetical protein
MDVILHFVWVAVVRRQPRASWLTKTHAANSCAPATESELIVMPPQRAHIYAIFSTPQDWNPPKPGEKRRRRLKQAGTHPRRRTNMSCACGLVAPSAVRGPGCGSCWRWTNWGLGLVGGAVWMSRNRRHCLGWQDRLACAASGVRGVSAASSHRWDGETFCASGATAASVASTPVTSALIPHAAKANSI